MTLTSREPAYATYSKASLRAEIVANGAMKSTLHQPGQQFNVLTQIPHLRLLGWLLWAYSRCWGVNRGVDRALRGVSERNWQRLATNYGRCQAEESMARPGGLG